MFWLNVKQYIRTPAISLITVVYFLYLSYGVCEEKSVITNLL